MNDSVPAEMYPASERPIPEDLVPVDSVHQSLRDLGGHSGPDSSRLQHRDPLLRKVLDVLPIGVWIVDATGAIIYGNPAGQGIWGGARFVGADHYGEYLGWWTATGKPVEPDEWAAARAISKGETSLNEQIDIACFDGARRTILNSAVPILGDQQQLLGAVVLNQDISASKRTETERERLLTALDQAGEIVFTTRPDGTIDYVNAAFEAVTGYERQEVIGRTPNLLNSGMQPPEFYRDLWETIASGRMWRGRMVNRRKDGSHFVQDATISPTVDACGRVINYVAVTRDVTEQLQVEDRLANAQKMEAIGTLAGGIAHDFNNLLSVILGFSNHMLRQFPIDSTYRGDLEEIARAGERAVALTRQLLAFSRNQILEPRLLRCNDLISGLASMLRRLIGENIQLVTRLASDLGVVLADPGQLEQSLTNLVVNARDAMPRGGTITIETLNVELTPEDCFGALLVSPGRYVQILVVDTGVGMDETTMRRAFEPFFTTKPKDRGTGLGLATVYGIIQQSGGGINVASELGKGTTFKLYLPRQEARAEALINRRHDSQPCRGTETILVVEDDDAVRRATARLLGAAGYRVLAAANGTEAFQLFDRNVGAIRLLLTDVIMPEMGGVQVAVALKAKEPSLRVLFMSGYPDDQLDSAFVGAIGARSIRKPFENNELERAVRAILDNAEVTKST